jgi:prevent-host-death family protein
LPLSIYDSDLYLDLNKELDMSSICISEDILPLGEFKTHASRVLRGMRQHGRPLVITQNGRPAAVLLMPEEFDRLTERERFVRSVQAGLRDAEAGRTISDEELGRDLDRREDAPGS